MQERDSLTQLLRAYDLNPLLQLDMQHNYKLCAVNSFVAPRQNKVRLGDQRAETLFFNVSMRDACFHKIKVIKVVHAVCRRKLFIFYPKKQVG